MPQFPSSTLGIRGLDAHVRDTDVPIRRRHGRGRNPAHTGCSRRYRCPSVEELAPPRAWQRAPRRERRSSCRARRWFRRHGCHGHSRRRSCLCPSPSQSTPPAMFPARSGCSRSIPESSTATWTPSPVPEVDVRIDSLDASRQALQRRRGTRRRGRFDCERPSARTGRRVGKRHDPPERSRHSPSTPNGSSGRPPLRNARHARAIVASGSASPRRTTM